MFKRQLRWFAVLAVFFTVGCSNAPELQPRLAYLYNRSAMTEDVYRNPVIVIPGILGSRLKQQGTPNLVWGAFTNQFVAPDTPKGARLSALPMENGVALKDLTDDVVPDGVLDRVKIDVLGIPVTLNAYFNILATLGSGGYQDAEIKDAGAIDYGKEHFTCFQFSYDWRRSNDENAVKLHQFILEKKAYVKRKRKELFGIEGEVRFDIVAHSMGGLITRYYLRYGPQLLPESGGTPDLNWAGVEHVQQAILIGTPNAGSVKALKQLVEGADIGPLLPYYSPTVLGTMPAIYQLLPRVRHLRVIDEKKRPVDIMDPAVWIKNGWGLADPKRTESLAELLPNVEPAERQKVALDHLKKSLKRAQQFQQALDIPASHRRVELKIFVGDTTKTTSKYRVNGDKTLTLIENAPGDGTVTRSSALMDERLDGEWQRTIRSPIRWNQVLFVPADHVGLTKSPVFSDNVLYMLLEQAAFSGEDTAINDTAVPPLPASQPTSDSHKQPLKNTQDHKTQNH